MSSPFASHPGGVKGEVANDNSVARVAGHGVHLRLPGAEVLVSHYPGGVNLGMMTGAIRCGVGLNHEDARSLALALLKGLEGEAPPHASAD